MDTEKITQDSELIFRRLLETLPEWGLLFPVGFAFVVLFLILFFRQQETVGDLFKRARIPGVIPGVLGLVWTLGLFAFLGYLGYVLFEGAAPNTDLLRNVGLPLLAFPVLLGLFIAVMLCVRNPRTLIPVAGMAVAGGIYLAAGHLFLPVFGWWVVLTPFLVLALVYVALMYVRDAQTIHPGWAAFLALLRCTVYAILAAVFLLPGRQNYQTTETRSKVLVLFDVSGSMRYLVDDRPETGQDPRTLLTRQAKVVKFLTDPAGPSNPQTFMDRVQVKSPATVYRFGAILDDVNVEQFLGGRKWDKEKWTAWLNPDRKEIKVPEEVGGKKVPPDEQLKIRLKLQGLYDDLLTGTNVSGAGLQAALREAGNQLQAIIIISDGQSNVGSSETFRELQARAANPKGKIHLITVGVGAYREPVGIRLQDLQAPDQARPDDKFPIRVPVIGDGLRDKEFEVTLEGIRVVKKGEKWVETNDKTRLLTQRGRFKGAGDHPFDEVEFEIDMRDLRGIKPGDESKDDQVEGTWEFRAHIPRDPGEAFPEREHVSKRPARVVVQKRKLRVLLFAGGPSREYQFVRTLFFREVQEKRMDLAIYLQSAGEKDVDQDVESEYLLTRFPDHLGGAKADKTHSDLNEYDVIIAFDPDWSRLDTAQLRLLQQWVSGPSAGGLVVVAGPVYTYQVARPGTQDITPLLTIFPVVLKDSRLHGIGIGHDASRPYALNFPEGAKAYDFLKIDETTEDPLGGWQKFFWGDAKPPEPGKDNRPLRGFYNYYPVEKLKPNSIVMATFAGPVAARINDGKDEQPYIVAMPYGAGKTVYLSAAEFWRLRNYKTTYNERFWVKLARYAGSGNLGRLSRYGKILMAQSAPLGLVPMEAQVLGPDMLPLPRDATVKVKVTRPADFDDKTDKETPESFELKAKPGQGDWNGYFAGKFRVNTPGDYTLKIEIPETSQYLSQDLNVYRPNPETDVTKPDHGHLYQLATSAQPILNRLKEKDRQELLRILKPPVAPPEGEKEGETRPEVRLFFPLSAAHHIPDYLANVEPSRNSVKGRLEDIWDQGVETGWSMRADYFIMLAVGAIGLLAFGILAFLRRWVLAGVAAAVTCAVVFGVVLVSLTFAPPWADLALNLSYVLALVVGLLSVEWLTRKLLKLA